MSTTTTLTTAKLAANRANAQRSTGPATPEGKARASRNSLKHGCYAEASRETMLALGEDPEEFDALLADLLDAYAPEDAIGRQMVEDLAKLYWRQRRWERASDGLLRAERKRWELDQHARAQGQPSGNETISRDYFARLGMRWHAGPAAQVDRLAELLATVRQRVEEKNFSEDLEWVFKLLYGETPLHRGQLIWFLWNYLHASHRAGKPVPETACEVLKKEVDEEIAGLRQSAERWERSREELAPAERDALLMPSSAQLEWMIEQGNRLDRAIDRKIRLLLAYRKKNSESRSQNSEVRSDLRTPMESIGLQKSERQKSEDGNREQGTGNRESGTGNRERGTADAEAPDIRIEETKPESPLESTEGETAGGHLAARIGAQVTRDE
ncbi:MAG: hypothetical protein LAN62_16385 [Acidobacteriia bacterium]|nr:hypothetical protein [Terriglobia bacterium]